MSIYKNIMLAVDVRLPHESSIITRAIKFAKESNASLHFIHVMEPLYGYGPVEGKILIDLEMKIANEARKIFFDLVSGSGILSEQFILETGSPKRVIVEQAKELNVDLIIVGSHYKHGLNVLVGSTANAVINQVHCDVLCMRAAH